jgi:hypothetical protein
LLVDIDVALSALAQASPIEGSFVAVVHFAPCQFRLDAFGGVPQARYAGPGGGDGEITHLLLLLYVHTSERVLVSNASTGQQVIMIQHCASRLPCGGITREMMADQQTSAPLRDVSEHDGAYLA